MLNYKKVMRELIENKDTKSNSTYKRIYYLSETFNQMIGCVFMRTLTFPCGELSLISCTV